MPTVVFGQRPAVASVTNRPLMALRAVSTGFAPTCSVTVVLGHRPAAALLTKRPLMALRLRVAPLFDLLIQASSA